AEVERAAELRTRERERPPRVVRRDRVVGVGNRDEVRNGGSPDVLRGRRPTPGRREEERLRDRAVVHQDLARGRVDRGGRARLLVVEAEVDLAARVLVDVER